MFENCVKVDNWAAFGTETFKYTLTKHILSQNKVNRAGIKMSPHRY